MHSKKQFFQNAFPVSMLFLCCSQVCANQINGSLSATSLFSDNTLKQAQNPIDERQDLYQLAVVADYSNWLLDADVNYQLVAQKYAEGSQDDEEYADGSSSVTFGKAEDLLALELSHSRRMLLSTPDAIDLTGNQEARDIISARPEIRIKLSEADKLLLSGQSERVSFPDNGQQDSKRNGASLGWLHLLSPTSTLQLSVNQQDIKFDNYALSDYSLVSSMLAYAVELRKLKYSLAVGYNENKSEGNESKSAPSYKISAAYVAGYNQIDLSASRLLTDTSYGDGNMENTFVLPDSDGFSMDLDRIDRRSVELNWHTNVICSRCALSVGVVAVEDKYLEKDEESLSVNSNVSFAYALSTTANVSLSMARSDVDFENQLVAQDYRLDSISLNYAYYFSNGLNVTVGGRREDRETSTLDEAGTYTENVYSVSLAYGF
ncbi:hypothetical protein [Cellvibrio sp. NN19]|uniref:hypothetical protein n=1 Tax=Cellvibrio chitinivorans TaxID=3102792 RepID=UPI002B41243F|nr:hypothetical protein [Cellvibrio sp. NN19]